MERRSIAPFMFAWLLVLGTASRGDDRVVVYSSDFEAKLGTQFAEWRSSRIRYSGKPNGQASGEIESPAITNCESPNKRRRFLGEFGGPAIDPTARTRMEQTITLKVEKLAPHASAEVSFDLLVLHSWDGDSPRYGPDRLIVKPRGGKTVLNATFSNNPKTQADGSFQNYPQAGSPPWSGATEKNTLGYDYFGDSIYHFSLTFPHTGQTLELDFASDLMEGKGTADEAWGLDNVQVTIRPTAAPNVKADKPSSEKVAIEREKNGSDQAGFVSLIQGDDLSQFVLVGLDADSVSIHDGEIRMSGMPKGYLATKTSYRNYDLSFEWMYEQPKNLKPGEPFGGNSGLLLHIEQTKKVWPKSLEVQVWYKPEFGSFFTFEGARFNPMRDEHELLSKVLKPVGNWNRHEIRCNQGSVTVAINGQTIARGDGANPDHGQIGLMSEGDPIRFRNLKIKPLK